jgi:hypothetical protein
MFSVKKAVAARNNRQEMAGDKMGRAMPMRGNMADKASRAMPMMKKGGKVKSGSSASKRADGVAHKGKTKGKMVRMNYGGKC